MSSQKKSAKRGRKGAPIDSTAVFEKLLKRADAIQHYHLRLYITGTTPRSSLAIANISALCEEYLAGHYDLEVIDIYQQPDQAVKEQIIAVPTLVKELPIPPKRLIGDLSDRGKVIIGLDLKAKNPVVDKTARKVEWAKV
jgi:circadian clock protein KaiB